MKKIAITGPECSGKSTLAMMLSPKLGVNWIPEHARSYLQKLGRQYSQDDLDIIARRQQMMIDAVLSLDKTVLTDTEMLVLKIWSEEKYGACSPYIEALWQSQEMDLYILCKPDIPYEEDELRENPDDRDRLFDIYKSYLDERGVNYIVSTGDLQTRVDQALTAIANI
jgi:nicotinamide riboside kinase